MLQKKTAQNEITCKYATDESELIFDGMIKMSSLFICFLLLLF